MYMHGLAIGADGGGSCLQAVMDAELPISVVYTNVPGCKAVEARAKPAGIPVVELNPKEFGKGKEGRRAHELELEKRLAEFEFGAIVMLGDERVKTFDFVNGYAARGIPIFNTHPAPLPQFRGLNGYAWALGEHKNAVRRNEWTAVTFHIIDNEVDRGRIVAQSPLPVYEKDTVGELMERGKNIEYSQIVQCLEYFMEGRLVINNECETCDIESAEGAVLRGELPPLSREVICLPGDSAFIAIDSEMGKIAAGGAFGPRNFSYAVDRIPANLAFTYAYDAVKGMRMHGIDVKFNFDGMDIHPIIMKQDAEKGERPY